MICLLVVAVGAAIGLLVLRSNRRFTTLARGVALAERADIQHRLLMRQESEHVVRLT